MKYWEQIKEKILLSKQHIGPYSPNHNRLQDSLQKHKNRQISNIYIYSLHKLPNRQKHPIDKQSGMKYMYIYLSIVFDINLKHHYDHRAIHNIQYVNIVQRYCYYS
jgi:hypothetical protein